MTRDRTCSAGEYNGYRPPVEQFSIDFDMPLDLARCLIGRTEAETERNIEAMKEYLGMVVNESQKRRV